VQEAVASKYVTIFHLPGKYNPADILSKHWAYASVWQTMNALLFARGDTWDLLDDECKEEKASSWIHVICLDNTLLPRGVTRFA
jgi:hypothetical protein